VAAFTADIGILFITQPLHGMTFALLHLACTKALIPTSHRTKSRAFTR
jgi:hypothetical protein